VVDTKSLYEDRIMTTEFESVVDARAEADSFTPWSEELAQQIAIASGLGVLGEAHWRVIHTLRQHFVQYGAVPPAGLACGMSDLEPHCAEELFHSANEMWQVAGLPEPGFETPAY
jgi:sulfur relay (sulfurtransferase) DsrC/TusE family protein